MKANVNEGLKSFWESLRMSSTMKGLPLIYIFEISETIWLHHITTKKVLTKLYILMTKFSFTTIVKVLQLRLLMMISISTDPRYSFKSSTDNININI